MGSFFCDVLSMNHEVAIFDSDKERLRFTFNALRFTTNDEIKAFEPEMLLDTEPDQEFRDEKMRRMLEKLARVINPEKVNHYVEKHLGDRREMLASELPLENTDDFVKMIYIRLYGQRKNMRYTIAVKDMIKKDGYRFNDFTIHRKEH